MPGGAGVPLIAAKRKVVRRCRAPVGRAGACVRVREGGEVLDTIELDRGCFACMLGGAGNSTLFMVAQQWGGTANMQRGARTGQVLTTQAPSAHAGWP